MVRDDGLVDVHRALGRAGRAAGEVQKRGLLRVGRRDGEVRAGRGHQRAEVECARRRGPTVADEEDVLELR